ncbi:hypothetical protein B566_EDAN008897 [Ephemera danica]|nr:hypothetical protein B566_EDAN008897 [Ephemera danica]
MVAATSPAPAYLEVGGSSTAPGEAPDVECECPGPPPEFRLPPPPRPPFLQEPECSENSLADYETCDAVPLYISKSAS